MPVDPAEHDGPTDRQPERQRDNQRERERERERECKKITHINTVPQNIKCHTC